MRKPLLFVVAAVAHVEPSDARARVSVACVKTFIRISVCEVLCVVWFLVCVLTVVSALCSVLLCCSLCVPLFSVSLDLTGSFFIMCFCCYLLRTSCIILNIGLRVSMYVSFICNPSLLILYIYIYIYIILYFSSVFRCFLFSLFLRLSLQRTVRTRILETSILE
jgi:hypothetical protein